MISRSRSHSVFLAFVFRAKNGVYCPSSIFPGHGVKRYTSMMGVWWSQEESSGADAMVVLWSEKIASHHFLIPESALSRECAHTKASPIVRKKRPFGLTAEQLDLQFQARRCTWRSWACLKLQCLWARLGLGVVKHIQMFTPGLLALLHRHIRTHYSRESLMTWNGNDFTIPIEFGAFGKYQKLLLYKYNKFLFFVPSSTCHTEKCSDVTVSRDLRNPCSKEFFFLQIFVEQMARVIIHQLSQLTRSSHINIRDLLRSTSHFSILHIRFSFLPLWCTLLICPYNTLLISPVREVWSLFFFSADYTKARVRGENVTLKIWWTENPVKLKDEHTTCAA
jgi:hypothetical protein